MAKVMRRYMVKVKLPSELNDDFLNLIPAQRKRVNQMMREGDSLNYSLSMDRSQLWIVMQGETENKIMDGLATFPLIRYMSVEVVELMFHESPLLTLQPISLN